MSDEPDGGCFLATSLAVAVTWGLMAALWWLTHQ